MTLTTFQVGVGFYNIYMYASQLTGILDLLIRLRQLRSWRFIHTPHTLDLNLR